MTRALLVLVLVLSACASGREVPRTRSALEARWRARAGEGRRVVATAVYRDLLARSLFGRCKMVPTDSQIFDVRARRCGALAAAVMGVSRLFLEASATPRFLAPLTLDGRLRWWDVPGRDPCSP